MNPFDALLVNPIINVLVAIYHLLAWLTIPSALGFAIIVLTVLIRFLLSPLTSSQLKASKKMQELSPHLSKLREKHKGDAQRLQQETMALYREHGVNPLAGCLPLIVQLPLLFALYQVLLRTVHFKSVQELNRLLYFDFLKLNHLWNTTFFGLPLDKTPADLLPKVGIAILLVAIVTGALQFIQSKMMTPTQPAPAQKPEKKGDDFATMFQTQTVYLLPVMIGFFSFRFPLGLSLYWNTFTVFGIIQQYRLQGLGGLLGQPKKSETKT